MGLRFVLKPVATIKRNRDSNIIQRNVEAMIIEESDENFVASVNDGEHCYPLTEKSFDTKGKTRVYRLHKIKGKRWLYIRTEQSALFHLYLHIPFTHKTKIRGNVIKDNDKLLFDIKEILS